MNNGGPENPTGSGRVDLALLHYPVVNRQGEEICSSVTNLDLHDIARAARTFGAGTFYVATPFADQRQLAGELLAHWLQGGGGRRNPERREALKLVRLCRDLDEVEDSVIARYGRRPVVLGTGARLEEGTGIWSYQSVRRRLCEGGNFLVLFGTAWGLAPRVRERTDGFLPSIKGGGDYNHLSVRSAAAIVLDRLLGGRNTDTIR